MRIEVDDIMQAFKNNSYEMEYFLDLETGEVTFTMDEGYGGDEVKEQSKLIKSKKKRFKPIPRTSSHEAFAFMERFVDEEAPKHAKHRLESALQGRKPFRNFKDTLSEFEGLDQVWYQFERDCYAEVTKEWFAEEGIEAEVVDRFAQQRPPRQPELDALSAAADFHRLALENEWVRVFETKVAPGETVPLHTHKLSAALYVLSWSHFVRRDEQGKVLLDTRANRITMTPGEAIWAEPLGPHTLENVGDKELHIVCVEVKG